MVFFATWRDVSPLPVVAQVSSKVETIDDWHIIIICDCIWLLSCRLADASSKNHCEAVAKGPSTRFFPAHASISSRPSMRVLETIKLDDPAKSVNMGGTID